MKLGVNGDRLDSMAYWSEIIDEIRGIYYDPFTTARRFLGV